MVLQIERERLKEIKRKAEYQAEWRNHTSFDADTVALHAAWLNRYYRSRGARFPLLDSQGLDLATFHEPEANQLYLFHQYNGV
jgi:hypothetical protein